MGPGLGSAIMAGKCRLAPHLLGFVQPATQRQPISGRNFTPKKLRCGADADGEASLALFCHRSLPRSTRRIPFIQCVYEDEDLSASTVTMTDTNLEHARSLVELVNYFENFTKDRITSRESFLLRYEDLVSHPEESLAWLRNIGLTPDLGGASNKWKTIRLHRPWLHRFGAGRAEYIPPEVSSFFERHLGREMVN